MIKDTHQQIVTKLRVELHSAIGHILQPDIALDHDQRAGLGGSERGRCKNHLVVNTFTKLPAMRSSKRHTKAIAKRDQRLPNLRLEKNDDGDADIEAVRC